MDWAETFYSTTGRWWGPAESGVSDEDHARVARLERVAGAAPRSVLELGCGYGSTAVAAAQRGYRVTGVELTDRIEFGRDLLDGLDVEPPSLVRGDFYTVELAGRFDVVCYWNGFGIGSDADQRRLLRRVADEWLAEDGVALVDVANPLVWARWDGEEESREADPDEGYAHSLGERVSFDPVRNRATDTWWDRRTPDRPISQTIRCYTPADLELLLEGTGLRLAGLVVGEDDVDPSGEHPSLPPLLSDAYEYLAVLRASD